MRKNAIPRLIIVYVALLLSFDSFGQAYRFKIVNIIPASLSNEVNNDAEPNIAVNPLNPNVIAISAFTATTNRVGPDGSLICDTFPCPRIIDTFFRHEPMPGCRAPLYFSTDSGDQWSLKDVLPSNSGLTHDISVSFSEAGYLYAAILKGCQFGRLDLGNAHNNLKGLLALRTTSPINSRASLDELTIMDPMYNRFGYKFDMPWVVAKTESVASSYPGIEPPREVEHVFVGVNFFGNARTSRNLKMGKSAMIMGSHFGVSSPFSFLPDTIESRPQRDKNPAGIRIAAHNAGKVYAIFYSAPGERYETVEAEQCDIMVVRDDDFGRTGFQNLTNGSFNGAVVEENVTLPLHFLNRSRGYFGVNRITGSDLAVAVDPGDPNHVFVAWCSEDAGAYTLHFRHNTNGGQGTWLSLNNNLNSIKHAFNPAIAITDDGKVGLLYQKLSSEGWWETHFTMGTIRAKRLEPVHDWILSRFRNEEFELINENRRWLSDYHDLQAAGNKFYGVFSAINTPDPPQRRTTQHSRFPTVRPLYLRDETLLLGTSEPDMIGGLPAAVKPSIDPFFFRVEPIPPGKK